MRLRQPRAQGSATQPAALADTHTAAESPIPCSGKAAQQELGPGLWEILEGVPPPTALPSASCPSAVSWPPLAWESRNQPHSRLCSCVMCYCLLSFPLPFLSFLSLFPVPSFSFSSLSLLPSFSTLSLPSPFSLPSLSLPSPLALSSLFPLPTLPPSPLIFPSHLPPCPLLALSCVPAGIGARPATAATAPPGGHLRGVQRVPPGDTAGGNEATRRDRRGHGERRTGTRGGTRNTLMLIAFPHQCRSCCRILCAARTHPHRGDGGTVLAPVTSVCHGKHGEVALNSGRHLHCSLLWLTLDKRWPPAAAWKSVFSTFNKLSPLKSNHYQ